MDEGRMVQLRTQMERLRTFITTKKFWVGASKSEKNTIRYQAKHYVLEGDTMFHTNHKGKKKEVITSLERVREIIYMAHAYGDQGHSGIEATTKKISRNFTWGSIKVDVREYIKQCSVCQTHKRQTQAPVVTPISISKPIDPFKMNLMVRAMVSQLMSKSSLENYQADTTEHVRGDPDVTATALSHLPEPQNILPQCDFSAVVKEEVCDDVDIKTEESDEGQMQTDLPTPSDTDSNSHDTLDDNTFVITATSCTEPDTETAQCLPVMRTASEMLDGNIFVIAATPCTEPDTETAQCLPETRTASKRISQKLRQRYSHIGKGLRAHERERRLFREYMKSETDRNDSEVKLNKIKRKVALLKKHKLQLQILMLQQRLNLQNRQTKNGFNKE